MMVIALIMQDNTVIHIYQRSLKMFSGSGTKLSC
ncbi:hypothetical protein Gorai_020899 [Gossypium raimondii]|uniref:Uncharacterized protein n=1 Tax=Gossypium raimondii TaxID=29730 RepID=A0A7J8NPA4_GOSRA|nr:hypothetical protein [Gossypium raimondii]